MRSPDLVDWHQDLVYNSMWSLLVEVERWNKTVDNGEGGKKIERVLMTGLATGVGNISAPKCAQQMILAVKHFANGIPERVVWSNAGKFIREVNGTVGM